MKNKEYVRCYMEKSTDSTYAGKKGITSEERVIILRNDMIITINIPKMFFNIIYSKQTTLNRSPKLYNWITTLSIVQF